jgi:hypothetical protein
MRREGLREERPGPKARERGVMAFLRAGGIYRFNGHEFVIDHGRDVAFTADAASRVCAPTLALRLARAGIAIVWRDGRDEAGPQLRLGAMPAPSEERGF